MVLICAGRGEHITRNQATMGNIYRFHKPYYQGSVRAVLRLGIKLDKTANCTDTDRCNEHRWGLFNSYSSVSQQLECFLNPVSLHIHPAKSPFEAFGARERERAAVLNAGLGNHLSVTCKCMNQTCYCRLRVGVGARVDTSCTSQPHGSQLCTTVF